MKQVEILQIGRYSVFTPGDRVRAALRQAGDVIEYPDWYADDLVASGMAREVMAEPAPEPEPVHEPDPDPVPEPEPDFKLSVDLPFLFIDGVNHRVAYALAAAGYNTLEDLAAADKTALLAVRGIGPAMLGCIRDYLVRAHLLESDA